MALGLLNINYESIVLPYDDETTPKELTGVKMLPIFTYSDGRSSNESLDIISEFDKSDKLNLSKLNELERETVEELLSEIGSNVHSLCMPYWMWTPEFNNQSRKYFQTKKEVKRGPFHKLIQNREKFLVGLNSSLEKLSKDVTTFYKSETISIFDIMIASHLWGMYIFPEFQFPIKVNEYLQRVKKECNFDYHEDFWRD